MSYSCSLTMSYKSGYIHCATIDGNEVIRVQVDKFAYAIQVKSVFAAKMMITKHEKRIWL